MHRTPTESGSPLPRTCRARGIYTQPSPAGMVRLQAIDSHGNEFAHVLLAESAYCDRVAALFRSLLDEADPVGRLVLVRPERQRADAHPSPAGILERGP